MKKKKKTMPRNQRLSLSSVWALSLSILYNSVFCIGHHLLERKSSSKHLLLFFALFVLQSRVAIIIIIIIVIEFVTSSVLLFSQHFLELLFGDWKKTVVVYVVVQRFDVSPRRRGRKDVRRAHHPQHAQKDDRHERFPVDWSTFRSFPPRRKGLRGGRRQSRRLFGRVHVYIYIYLFLLCRERRENFF